MSAPFRTTIEVRWADLDGNRHVRNTAFSDYATQGRLRYLDSRGFTPDLFIRLGVAPIFFREETLYRRELRLGDTVTVELRSDGLAPDASRWRVIHTILRDGEQEAALVTVEGAWIDLAARRLVPPPPDVADAMRSLAPTETFAELKSVLR